MIAEAFKNAKSIGCSVWLMLGSLSLMSIQKIRTATNTPSTAIMVVNSFLTNRMISFFCRMKRSNELVSMVSIISQIVAPCGNHERLFENIGVDEMSHSG